MFRGPLSASRTNSPMEGASHVVILSYLKERIEFCEEIPR